MVKQATSAKEQIDILCRRGIEIDMEENEAEEILTDIGYFRLGFYCFPFETTYPNKKKRNHEYGKGTRFSNIVDLYYFNVDLSEILLRYINSIEVNFRTNVVYRVSNKYKDCPTWFISPDIMQKDFVNTFEEKFYKQLKENNSTIKDHHKKYLNDRYAPAWKTLEFLTFGTILKIYKSLKDDGLQKEISLQYGIKNPEYLIEYIRSIVEIRNICAHGGVLFDHSLRKSLSPKGVVNFGTSRNRSNLMCVIKIMMFLLAHMRQIKEYNFEDDIKNLFKRQKNNKSIFSIIKKCIGFDESNKKILDI
ncbi:MAG: Abi family protein [Bacteroidales bacterium]|jgi:abortive infection bacteriophage resistance protein|nr:Abi family protein [Bacteroidales bacterium]